MTLNDLKINEYARITALNTSERESIFLSSLGMTVGHRVRLVARNWGNLIISCRGTRIALSVELSQLCECASEKTEQLSI